MMSNDEIKMTGESLDIASERRDELKQLFPGVFTETTDASGNVIEAVDFERLKAELGSFTDVYEGRRERYGMDWPGKRDCMKLIQEPTRATLKPCREESVDFDNTKNLFIEGDNLEVLKLLQKSYYGKVKMIYIDPPYNTGKEFIYPDKFQENIDTYLKYAGLTDDEGKKFTTNTSSDGRFHTKWMNMMYPRLYLARNLLKEDGVIFLSIGEDEVLNLRLICNEIFGEENFVGMVTWKSRVKPVNVGDSKYRPQKEVEYVLIYQRQLVEGMFKPLYTGSTRSYPHEINGRKYRITTILKSNRGANKRDTMVFELEGYKPPEGQRWQAGEDVINQLYTDGYIEFKEGTPFKRYFEDEEGAEHDPFYCFMEVDRSSTSEAGKTQLNELVGNDHGFDTVKPVKLIKTLLQSVLSPEKDNIVLDFFAGSGTTSHAICEILSDNPNIDVNWILVQLPEESGVSSSFDTVSTLSLERINKVFEKYQEDLLNNFGVIDFGYKNFKLNLSNFKEWNSNIEGGENEINKQIELHVNHIDKAASQEEVLYELFLKAGFEITEDVEELVFHGKTVFSIVKGALMVCLEDNLTSELIDAVADTEPMQFICLDRGFNGNDQLKANAVQTFKSRSQNSESELVFKVV